MAANETLAPAPRVGWVFGGGGARGAYEVGVCDYIFNHVAADLGRMPPLDVISGTSVGALHAAALASWADDPPTGMKVLVERWSELALEDVIRLDRRRLFTMMRALVGHPPRRMSPEMQRGGILDPSPLERLLSSSVEFERIAGHLRSGRLTAVSLSATHVNSGETAVFYQGEPPEAPYRMGRRTRVQAVKLTAAHALASAAIPFLFPAVRIEGELYCDGSLRQHVPLSPARHLGATALVVISPKRAEAPRGATPGPAVSAEHENAFPGPLFLLGKTLNALTLDRLDGDLERVARVNELLAAGQRKYGGTFVPDLNRSLAEVGAAPVRPLALLPFHPSEDIGQMAAAFVRSRRFRAREGAVARAVRRMAEGEGKKEADMLSYLLFDGWFARDLIAMGQRDAQQQHDQIVTFFRSVAGPDPLVDVAAAR
jgi:NTE family protein